MPLKLQIKRGTESQILNSTVAVGELCFATDTKSLFSFDGVAKQLIGKVVVNIFSQRPAYGIAGRLFYATDTEDLYLDLGSSWIKVSDDDSIIGVAGEALSRYDVVYCDTQDSSKFKKSFNNDTGEKANAIGIVSQQGGIASGSTGEITLFGSITNSSWDLIPGGLVYVDAAAGALTQIEPSELGIYIKPIGEATSSDTIWFQPRTGWVVNAGATGSGDGVLKTPSHGQLYVFPAYYSKTTMSTILFDSENVGLSVMWLQPIDASLFAVSIYIDSVTNPGDINIELLNGETNAVIQTLGSVSCGNSRGWVRKTWSQVSLMSGSFYKLRLTGSASASYSLAYNGASVDKASSLPDNVECFYTDDGWSSSVHLVALPETKAMPLLVINSSSNHVPQICFGREIGKFIHVPEYGAVTIPADGLFYDCESFSDPICYIYGFHTGGVLELELSSTPPTTYQGFRIKPGNSTRLYLGAVAPRVINGAYKGPIDVSDARLVMNTYNKKLKDLGKDNPYRDDTVESPVSGVYDSWLGGDDWTVEYLNDRMDYQTAELTADIVVKTRGSSNFCTLSFLSSDKTPLSGSSRVKVRTDSDSFMYFPTSFKCRLNKDFRELNTIFPGRITSAASDISIIYFENTSDQSGTSAKICGNFSC
jgi:hypothetical protein